MVIYWAISNIPSWRERSYDLRSWRIIFTKKKFCRFFLSWYHGLPEVEYNVNICFFMLCLRASSILHRKSDFLKFFVSQSRRVCWGGWRYWRYFEKFGNTSTPLVESLTNIFCKIKWNCDNYFRFYTIFSTTVISSYSLLFPSQPSYWHKKFLPLSYRAYVKRACHIPRSVSKTLFPFIWPRAGFSVITWRWFWHWTRRSKFLLGIFCIVPDLLVVFFGKNCLSISDMVQWLLLTTYLATEKKTDVDFLQP